MPDDLTRWDHEIPANIHDVAQLLRRRIEVHLRWADFMAGGSDESKSAEAAGVGTVESHRRYASQYEAVIELIDS